MSTTQHDYTSQLTILEPHVPLAELILDSSPTNFESFYFKLTDQTTSMVVLLASKDQFKRLRSNLGEAPGLYVLQAEDSTVYVGQSKNLRDRLKTHRSNDKIRFRRVMAMYRDQSLSRYLDYAEARLYQTLKELGFTLDQSSLSSSLDVKKGRLLALDREHVSTADGMIRQFLSYIVALGLSKPLAVHHHQHHHHHLHTAEAPTSSPAASPVSRAVPSPRAVEPAPPALEHTVARPLFAPSTRAAPRPDKDDDEGPRALSF